MVLHLLGKKSWNVYNSDNVDRVRRDEAEALAREEADEQRTQEEDAARRLAILRGQEPPELVAERPASGNASARSSTQPRKRRKLRGEDDTAAEIRHARQDVEAGERARTTLAKAGNDHDAPLLDHAGHLQLIPAPNEKDIRKAEKNAEVEAEKAKKRKREEDQYTMRFSNAAGFNSSMQQKPWYAAGREPPEQSSSSAMALADVQGKDVWGNEDPRRKEREQNRMSKSDPFAAMQQAQRQLKQSERDREKWQTERDKEMEEMRRAEKRERRRSKEKHRRRHHDDSDSLDGFSLDGPVEKATSDHDRHKRHKHRRRRSRSRSPSREKRRRTRV